MKLVTYLLAGVVSLTATNLCATPEDDRFQKLAKDYIEGLLQANPEYATSLGDHRFDDKLTDYSDDAVANELKRAKDFKQQLEAFSDLTKLTGPNRVDVRLLKDNIDNEIFGIEELKEREWNPLLYNESLANSLYLLVALASDMSMEDLMKAARADLEQTQKAIYETALPLYKKQFPNADEATLADRKKVTAAVLDKLAEQRPNDNTIVDYSKTVLKEATDFVKAKKLVTVPTTPVDIIVMPEFKRGQAIAYCDSPGPLEKNGKTFFAVAPTPDDWNQQRKDSFFREYNNFMIRDLTVHEAMPGHYLQLAHSNEFRAPTLVRAIFQSGTFIDGWAVCSY